MDIEAFRRRQEADLQRYSGGERVIRRRPFHERYGHLAQYSTGASAYDGAGDTASEDDDDNDEEEPLRGRMNKRASDEGEEAYVSCSPDPYAATADLLNSWRNKEGERLADFGLDEDAEFYDEDDLPLSELMRRRKTQQ